MFVTNLALYQQCKGILEEQRLKHFEYVHGCIKLHTTKSTLLSFEKLKNRTYIIYIYIPAIDWVYAISWGIQECKI